MELATDLSCEQKVIDELSTSVIEACTNAMEHGNHLQENEQVEIHFNLDDNSIQVTVLDNGSGFDYVNWTPSEDLMRERGRGILIMREFTDSLDFDYIKDGRFRVRLSKNFNSKP
jgi:serine/threonine-protein kinase RsbW